MSEQRIRVGMYLPAPVYRSVQQAALQAGVSYTTYIQACLMHGLRNQDTLDPVLARVADEHYDRRSVAGRENALKRWSTEH